MLQLFLYYVEMEPTIFRQADASDVCEEFEKHAFRGALQVDSNPWQLSVREFYLSQMKVLDQTCICDDDVDVAVVAVVAGQTPFL